MRVLGFWVARIVSVLGTAALVSCGGLRHTYLADGSRGYAISCRGFLNTWDSCLVKAGKVCGTRGYETIEEDRYGRTLLIGCHSSTSAAAGAGTH
jgi:hypothetical protein